MREAGALFGRFMMVINFETISVSGLNCLIQLNPKSEKKERILCIKMHFEDRSRNTESPQGRTSDAHLAFLIKLAARPACCSITIPHKARLVLLFIPHE